MMGFEHILYLREGGFLLYGAAAGVLLLPGDWDAGNGLTSGSYGMRLPFPA